MSECNLIYLGTQRDYRMKTTFDDVRLRNRKWSKKTNVPNSRLPTYEFSFIILCHYLGNEFVIEYIQSNGDIFENSIPQHRWLFEL